MREGLIVPNNNYENKLFYPLRGGSAERVISEPGPGLSDGAKVDLVLGRRGLKNYGRISIRFSSKRCKTLRNKKGDLYYDNG